MADTPLSKRGSRFSRRLGIRFLVADENQVVATITLGKDQEGPPNHVHGGVSASLLDEVMGNAVWTEGRRVLAANLNVNYRKPVPLHTELRLHGWIDAVKGRKVFTKGKLTLPNGDVAVEASGLFIEADLVKNASLVFDDDENS